MGTVLYFAPERDHSHHISQPQYTHTFRMDVQSGAIKGPQQADASPQATSPIAAGEGTGTGTPNGHEQSAEHSHKHGMKWLTIEYRLYGVILIAACFLVAELVIGFTNNALVLVADAFHITSDLIGYVVSVVCIRLAQRGRDGKKDDRPREGFSFGWQRAEILSAAFNGVFLLALGVSVILQSVDRFINPSELTNPILVAIIGAAGIGSNFLMVLLLGGHNHSHGHGTPMDELTSSGEHVHADHAHYTRSQPKKADSISTYWVSFCIYWEMPSTAWQSLFQRSSI